MAGVISVERLSITVPNTQQSGSGSLTMGQVAANCVPFATCRVGATLTSPADDFDDLQCDVHISGSTVTVDRLGTHGEILCHVTIVEFDPSLVTVQQGTFTIANTATSGTASCTAVDQGKAAMVFYARTSTSATPDSYGENAVRGRFTSDTQLTFSREIADQALTGHWYIFEDTNPTINLWNVQPFTISMGNGELTGSATLDPPVTTAKSFTIASHDTTVANDDAQNATPVVYLASSTGVSAARVAHNTTTLTISGFVVTFAAAGGEAVQRGLLSFTTGDSSLSGTLSPSVDTAVAMPWVPTASGGISSGSGAGVATGDVPCAYARAQLATVATEFDRMTLDRTISGLVSSTLAARWEVVSWSLASFSLSGQTKNNSGVALGSCDVYLLKHTGGVLTYLAKTTSDASTGAYSFDGLSDQDPNYLVIARKAGSPNVFDVTDFTLTPS